MTLQIQTTRVANDQYFTPPKDVYTVLPYVADAILRRNPTGLIVEPSAGSGHVLRCLRNVGIPRDRLLGLEIDPVQVEAASQYAPTLHCDTLHTDIKGSLHGGAALIIGNPPYNLAAQFVKWGIKHLAPGGTMLYLLRTGFSGSRGRAPLLRRTTPGLLTLPGRPSFVHKRKTVQGKLVTQTTDQYTYAWFKWEYAENECRFERVGNVWLDDDLDKVEQHLIAKNLQVPHDLRWKYTPPLVDAQGNLLRPVQYGPKS